jgi:beta-ureidopropionase / N-carbamoyl-L-amino-acid hydrolase
MLTINPERLLNTIEVLAQIGGLPEGGVKRIAYSPQDLAARAQVQQWMQSAGMTTRLDAVGNLIGRYLGQNLDLPALVTGSHIDTVPTGGRYDGSYGVLAGIEVVRVLHENQLRLQHPIEVIVFTDEEGTMVGSKGMAGNLLDDPRRYRHSDGSEIQTCLQQLGGNWEDRAKAKRSQSEIAAFVELHVEQGPVLETAAKTIGIVEGIVGQRRFMVSVTGFASHAGTTPMSMRRDALVAAAQLVVFVNQLANSGGQQVATVGQLTVQPNAVNVIPSRVDFSLDIRDLSNEKLDVLLLAFTEKINEIANETHTQIEIAPKLRNEPAPTNTAIQTMIEQVCQALNLSYLYLPSRASHDAQDLATIAPMGMIFVPSQSGVSHAESEYTSPEHCVQGANVLLHTFLKMDEKINQNSWI